jgi:pyruvate dehydrogenase E2 component (dihydrolipoamide acetyltransferase)
MATPVIMPKLGMTMEEGTVVRWLKTDGEAVEKGEPLLEIMTDKAIVDVETPATGIVQWICAAVNATVPVAQLIAYILAPGEPLPAPSAPAAPAPEVPVATPSTAPTVAPCAGRIFASPLAKKRAREAGLDLRTVKGSGPGGRIIGVDIQAALAALEKAKIASVPTAVAPAPVSVVQAVGQPVPAMVVAAQLGSGKLVSLSGRRKIIAERMTASAAVPQFALGLDVDMVQAEEARGSCSVTAFLLRVVARALPKHPFVNASLRRDGIFLHEAANIGVAVNTDEGLLVPVVKQAEHKSLATLDQELKDLSARARAGTLSPDEASGATFTISNLGMLGIEEFKALVNPPQAAILAAGRTTPKPVASHDAIVVRPVLHLVLSADHRVLDGATAAAFLTEVKRLIENPYLLL